MAERQSSGRNSEMIEELTMDIGRILHANTSTLLMVNQTLVATIETLNPAGTSPDELDIDDIETDAKTSAAHLASAIEKLCDSGTEERRTASLPEHEWQVLANQVELLRHVETIVEVRETRLPALRSSAHRVRLLCTALEGGHLPREAVRDVVRLSVELERLACMTDALTTRAAVIQMDTSLRALRDFITANLRADEDTEKLDLDELVRESVAQLAEFTRAANVEIRIQHPSERPSVLGIRREIGRAVTNLLHNAIKYSWHRDRNKAPWVTIRYAGTSKGALVEFETWGVPITREEIDDGLVFQIGYRGKWSTDRGRLGTGIGLTDALRVARDHGGGIHIESRPAHTGVEETDPDYYRHPFITNVRLELGAAPQSREE